MLQFLHWDFLLAPYHSNKFCFTILERLELVCKINCRITTTTSFLSRQTRYINSSSSRLKVKETVKNSPNCTGRVCFALYFRCILVWNCFITNLIVMTVKQICRFKNFILAFHFCCLKWVFVPGNVKSMIITRLPSWCFFGNLFTTHSLYEV